MALFIKFLLSNNIEAIKNTAYGSATTLRAIVTGTSKRLLDQMTELQSSEKMFNKSIALNWVFESKLASFWLKNVTLYVE